MYDADNSTAITYNTDGAALADNAYFELNDNGFVVPKSGVSTDWAKDAAARTWAESVGTKVQEAKTAASDGDEVKWTGLEYGYYYVTSSLGAFISVDSANKAGVINEKNDKPSVDKEITGVKDSTGANDSMKTRRSSFAGIIAPWIVTSMGSIPIHLIRARQKGKFTMHS